MKKIKAAPSFVDALRYESYGLVKTIAACRFDSGFFQLLNGVLFGCVFSTAARIATFHFVVGDNFDVLPPRVTVKMRGSLSGSGKSKCNQQQRGQKSFHLGLSDDQDSRSKKITVPRVERCS